MNAYFSSKHLPRFAFAYQRGHRWVQSLDAWMACPNDVDCRMIGMKIGIQRRPNLYLSARTRRRPSPVPEYRNAAQTEVTGHLRTEQLPLYYHDGTACSPATEDSIDTRCRPGTAGDPPKLSKDHCRGAGFYSESILERYG